MLQVHRVDFLERPTLSLDYEEVDKDPTHQVTPGEYVTQCKVDILRDERREKGDQKVPCPVARRSKRHTPGTVFGGVNFGNQRPDHRAPGCGVAENEEGCHDNEGDALLRGVGGLLHVEREVAHGGEDHEADEHPDAAHDQGLAATVMLNQIETNKGHAEVDTV